MSDFTNFLKYRNALENDWTHCSWVHIEATNYYIEDTVLDKGFNQQEIEQWCKDRCSRDYVVVSGSV